MKRRRRAWWEKGHRRTSSESSWRNRGNSSKLRKSWRSSSTTRLLTTDQYQWITGMSERTARERYDLCAIAGIFQDCPVLHKNEFWPFFGLLIFSMFLPHNEIWPFFDAPRFWTSKKSRTMGVVNAEGGPEGIAWSAERSTLANCGVVRISLFQVAGRRLATLTGEMRCTTPQLGLRF